MATVFTRRIRRRPDSTAHAIAAELAPGTPLRQVRVPFGAQVARYKLNGGEHGITAAAEVIHGGNGKHRRRAPSQRWQDSAWELRDEVGELRFAGDRAARAASQCWLYIAEVPESDDDTPTPVDEGAVYELGRSMFGDRSASQQSIRLAGQHFQFNGECNLLITQDPDSREMTWTAHSVDELTGMPG